jgi:hypothetical protein
MARSRKHTALAVAAAGVLAVALPFAASASALAKSVHAVAIRPPSDAKPDSNALMTAVACVSTGSCTAGGTYLDNSNSEQASVVTSAGGRWPRPVALAMPSNANANPGAQVLSVSCARIGSCVAVGTYDSSSIQGFAATQSHGTWHRAQQLRLPSNSAAGISQLLAVSCTGPGSCVAVGNYQAMSRGSAGMVVTQTRGRWGQGREIRLPFNAAPSPAVSLVSVTCASAGQCVAAAQYLTKQNGFQVALVTESHGVWRRAVEVMLPKGAASSPDAGPDQVTCASAGQCTAIGQYTDQHNATFAFSVTESAGRWGRGHQVTVVPANAAAHPQMLLRSVACAKAGACVAVGSYLDRAGGTATLAAFLVKGKWAGADEVSPPAGAQQGGGLSAIATSVSCTTGGYCKAVGSYFTNTTHLQAMAARTPAT